ncbi:TetR family transcriptional regulator [Sphingobacterium sp. SYP-B4668]|uniref:TetR family transcriptional regulator n=1 Tax=Sphingobacterium sp. SYP-B4668 TaxID=2996035 RepID=UPI0022DE6056|nr:TetR family transcriptional regulator [Sphingobacterium sp. SYP-B4668]
MDINDKQLEILNVAENLFSIKGFDGTSVRDIASEANVNVAMINYYFGSKEGLLDTLINVRVENFKMNAAVLIGIASPLEKLEKMIELYVKSMNSNRGLYQVIAVESTIKRKLLLSESFKELKYHNLKVIEDIVQEGVNQGIFQGGNSCIHIHATLMGTFMNFQMNSLFLKTMLGLTSDEEYSNYIENEVVCYLQKNIRALLTYTSDPNSV